ncbi:MAG TPA: hypothetical protein VGJ15_05375, partial [Pirellulales bacterium]
MRSNLRRPAAASMALAGGMFWATLGNLSAEEPQTKSQQAEFASNSPDKSKEQRRTWDFSFGEQAAPGYTPVSADTVYGKPGEYGFDLGS